MRILFGALLFLLGNVALHFLFLRFCWPFVSNVNGCCTESDMTRRVEYLFSGTLKGPSSLLQGRSRTMRLHDGSKRDPRPRGSR